jgi:pectate lyase
MKLSLLALNLFALAAFAAPTATSEEVAAPAEIAKRATLTDVANGYASLNGGTKGGKGGTTTTLVTPTHSNCFKKAVKSGYHFRSLASESGFAKEPCHSIVPRSYHNRN